MGALPKENARQSTLLGAAQDFGLVPMLTSVDNKDLPRLLKFLTSPSRHRIDAGTNNDVRKPKLVEVSFPVHSQQ